MPSKYIRKKDRQPSAEAPEGSENSVSDRKVFLNVFEKPTRIYRYIRVRQKYAPSFLNRNLTYMKKINKCATPSAAPRRRLRPDDLLGVVTAARRERLLGQDKAYLNLHFSEFDANQADLGLPSSENVDGKEKSGVTAVVDVSIVKVVGHRRKERTTLLVEHVGMAVLSRPGASESKNALSLKTDWFVENSGHPVKAYKLKFNVTVGAGLAATKKRKAPSALVGVNGNASDDVSLVGELPVFELHKGCLLPGGKYEVFLRDERELPASNCKRPAWHSSWATLPKEAIDSSVHSLPVLRFEVSWTTKPVDVSLPHLELADAVTGSQVPPTRESFRMNAGTPSCSENLTNGASANLADKDPPQHRPIVFSFFAEGQRYQLTTTRHPWTCPWCVANCRDLYGLLKHIRLTHCRFKVYYTATEECDKVDVSMDEKYDGAYDGNPHDVIGCAFLRTGPVCRTPTTQIIVGAKRFTRDLREFVESSETAETTSKGRVLQLGHSRVYYHSITNQPVKPQELDSNSDDDTNPTWMHQMTTKMINEFTDVNEGEKAIMKLWNDHVSASRLIADCQMMSACKSFVKCYGTTIVERHLVNNCKLHFTNLLDNGLLKASEVVLLIQLLDSVVPTDAPPVQNSDPASA